MSTPPPSTTRLLLRLIGRKRIIVATGVIGLLLPAGAAWAMWTATGTGGGAGKAITAQALTVTGGTPSADLFPGHAGNVVFHVVNPNPYPVTITSAGSVSVASVGASGCIAADFTVPSGSTVGTIVGSGVVAANGNADVTLSGLLTMISASPDACQGTAVGVSATLNGTQS